MAAIMTAIRQSVIHIVQGNFGGSLVNQGGQVLQRKIS